MRGHRYVRLAAGRRERYRQRTDRTRTSHAGRASHGQDEGRQAVHRQVHDRAIHRQGESAVLGRHHQGQGPQQAGAQGERAHAGDARQRERCRRERQPAAATPAAAVAARQRLPNPGARPRPDQSPRAWPRRAHQPDPAAHRRRSRSRQPARQPAVRNHRDPHPGTLASTPLGQLTQILNALLALSPRMA